MQAVTRYLNLHQLARITGLASDWLKAQAKAGHIPFLPTSRGMMFNPKAVERTLAARTEGEVAGAR